MDRHRSLAIIIAGLIPATLLLVLGFLCWAPLATCPWCDMEIKHYGGRLRYCDGKSEGCDGSGRISTFRRWYWLIETQRIIHSGR